MARNEDIHNGIWADPPFEELSAEASLLFIWSWTNPLCGMSGVYKVSKRGMTQSKVDRASIDAALDELETARFLFYEDDVLFVRSRVKRLRQKTPQIAKSIVSDLSRIAADHPQRRRFLAEYVNEPWLADALATLTRPSGDPQLRPSAEPDPRPSVDPQSRVKGNGNGNGSGKGTGKGFFTSDARTPDARSADVRQQMRRWAAANVGDLPENDVLGALTALQIRPGIVITPDVVREYIDSIDRRRAAA